jgi:N-formylglutamate amidohydrolase
LVADHFQKHGFSVALNDPYPGGFITAHHGRPADNQHAIQIEISRALYMKEATYERLPHKMDRLRMVLDELLVALGQWNPD